MPVQPYLFPVRPIDYFISVCPQARIGHKFMGMSMFIGTMAVFMASRVMVTVVFRGWTDISSWEHTQCTHRIYEQ